MKRKMKKNKIIIPISLLILFAAAFCAFSAEVNKPSPQAQAQPLPQILQIQDNTYSYNPLGKPDPFKPFIDVEMTPAKKGAADKVKSIFPLLRMGVENFNLVGIVGDQIRRVAVVEDSAKRFYPLFVGTRIGLHNGKVADILSDRVVVHEGQGKKVKRIILKLRKN